MPRIGPIQDWKAKNSSAYLSRFASVDAQTLHQLEDLFGRIKVHRLKFGSDRRRGQCSRLRLRLHTKMSAASAVRIHATG